MSEKQAEAYLKFVAELKAEYEAAGVPLVYAEGTPTGLPENRGWVRFESALNGHKVYVPKSARVMGLSETTLPVQHLGGARPLTKVNGKIMARLVAEVPTIVLATVDGLMGSERIRPNAAPGTSQK